MAVVESSRGVVYGRAVGDVVEQLRFGKVGSCVTIVVIDTTSPQGLVPTVVIHLESSKRRSSYEQFKDAFR